MKKAPTLKKPFINNQIRAKEVRIVDEKGEQLGVMPLGQALQMAKERGLDLIQITEKVEPPVCKILDSGKYLYRLKKKERAKKDKKTGEIKGIRLSFGISDHDLETRIKQAEKFLNKGYRVRIEMRLKGRQKASKLADFAKAKIEKFSQALQARVSLKVERELKREPRGLTMIISRNP